MKISELIEELTDLQALDGDVEIYCLSTSEKGFYDVYKMICDEFDKRYKNKRKRDSKSFALRVGLSSMTDERYAICYEPKKQRNN